LSRKIESTDIVCGACRSRFYKSLAKAELTTSKRNNIRVDPEYEPPHSFQYFSNIRQQFTDFII
jgi:endo-1,4-beta-D-glucanase Y